ncbi:hypothetical protein Ddc_23691 [Ditylenchus destructor]|nr:hypothetical protein Ddc_23691 [Ditylenchus destructor]
MYYVCRRSTAVSSKHRRAGKLLCLRRYCSSHDKTERRVIYQNAPLGILRRDPMNGMKATIRAPEGRELALTKPLSSGRRPRVCTDKATVERPKTASC